MRKRDRDLRTRFNVEDSKNRQPEDISAIITRDFGAVALIAMIPRTINEPNGVIVIDDNKVKGDRETFKAFVDAQAKVLVLQEDGDFVSLTKARLMTSYIPCEAHMRPEYIDFYYQSPQRTKISVNGEMETDNPKSIRHFKDSVERISKPDDWIEFTCKSIGVVHLNRNIAISSLETDGDTIKITYASLSARQFQTIIFTVENAAQLANAILESTTRPDHANQKLNHGLFGHLAGIPATVELS